MNMKFIPVSDLHLKFVQSAYLLRFWPLPVLRQMLCFWSFWSFATKVSSQILKCSTLLTHRVLLRTRTCAPPPQEVPTSSSCRRTTRPMLHCVTSLAEKVAMEVFRGFVKRNLVENITAWLLTAAISSSNLFSFKFTILRGSPSIHTTQMLDVCKRPTDRHSSNHSPTYVSYCNTGSDKWRKKTQTSWPFPKLISCHRGGPFGPKWPRKGPFFQ